MCLLYIWEVVEKCNKIHDPLLSLSLSLGRNLPLAKVNRLKNSSFLNDFK